MSSGLFKMFSTNYVFTNHMYKEDLALNGCYAIKPNHTKSYIVDIYV